MNNSMSSSTNKRARRALLTTAVAGLVGMAGMAGPAWAAGATTVTVDETSIGSSWTLTTVNSGGGAFVAGPRTAPTGSGSFEFTIPDNGKVTLSTRTVAGLPLRAVDAVGYATYRAGTSTMPGNAAPALNMEVCAGGLSPSGCSGYTTLVWEPVYAYGTTANGNNPIVNDTWQTWDALGRTSTSYTGGWWSTRLIPGVPTAGSSFVSLAEIQWANPNAAILSFGVNVGKGPSGTFRGNADALTLSLKGRTTVYDFEHAIILTGKDECKDGGWMTSTSPSFRNQGDCVSSFASAGRTRPTG